MLVQVSDLSLTMKVLPGLATWAQCFAMYVTVVSTHQPQRVHDLMDYMSLIVKASLKYHYPSWIVYDQIFGSRQPKLKILSERGLTRVFIPNALLVWP